MGDVKVLSPAFDELARMALAIPLTLSPLMLARCGAYVDILLLWRQRLSLTAAASDRSIIVDHVLDSLYLVPFLKPGFRVADVGSGAGFPGVPLAIVCPEAHFVLIESRRKKANFLREVARSLPLTNATVAEQRAEDLMTTPFTGPFDIVVSRAVGPISELLGLAAPLLTENGLVIAMKGPKGRTEPADYPGFAAPNVVEYQLPNGAEHLLVVSQRQ